MRHPLCKNCFSRNKGNPSIQAAGGPPSCSLCHGSLEKIPSLANSALSQTSFEWNSFFFSSKIPPEWSVAEDSLWDSTPSANWHSLKNELNKLSIEALSKTGKKYAARNADAQVTIDFAAGSAPVFPLPLFIFSHYRKHSRDLAQSIWHCGKCHGKGCPECSNSGFARDSVERVLSDAAKAAFGASGAKLHASGREDIDVLMAGGGRPFVLEIANPKLRESGIGKFIESANSSGAVSLAGSTRKVGSEFVELVCNSHFEKEYEATVSADRPLTQADCEFLPGKSFLLSQQTPTRVLRRRADMVRKRKITVLEAELQPGGSMRLQLLADAGSYIKEFIHSDSGRTRPSISSLLSCLAECKELNVAKIHDAFIETCQL